jgi:hypothetical protein
MESVAPLHVPAPRDDDGATRWLVAIAATTWLHALSTMLGLRELRIVHRALREALPSVLDGAAIGTSLLCAAAFMGFALSRGASLARHMRRLLCGGVAALHLAGACTTAAHAALPFDAARTADAASLAAVLALVILTKRRGARLRRVVVVVLGVGTCGALFTPSLSTFGQAMTAMMCVALLVVAAWAQHERRFTRIVPRFIGATAMSALGLAATWAMAEASATSVVDATTPLTRIDDDAFAARLPGDVVRSTEALLIPRPCPRLHAAVSEAGDLRFAAYHCDWVCEFGPLCHPDEDFDDVIMQRAGLASATPVRRIHDEQGKDLRVAANLGHDAVMLRAWQFAVVVRTKSGAWPLDVAHRQATLDFFDSAQVAYHAEGDEHVLLLFEPLALRRAVLEAPPPPG